MTNDKAIDRLERMMFEYDFFVIEQDALNLAIEALQKQEPKPVQYTTDHTWGVKRKAPVCPVCDYYLAQVHWIGEGGERVSYCDKCGQAIDWSEDDDT